MRPGRFYHEHRRSHLVEVINQVEKEGAFFSETVAVMGRENKIIPEDMRWIRAIGFDYFRKKLSIERDFTKRFEGKRLSDLEKKFLATLAVQLSNRPELTSPIRETAELIMSAVKTDPKSGHGKFLWAICHELGRNPPELIAGVPYDLLDLADEEIPDDIRDRVMDTWLAPPAHSVIRTPELEETLKEMKAEEVAGIPELALIRSTRLQGFRARLQGAVSFFISKTLAQMVGQGGLILDTCSAPGGKSKTMEQFGAKVISMDINIHRMITPDLKWVVGDLMNPPVNFDQFKGVMLDLPCSGLGTLPQHPELLHTGVRRIESAENLQKDMLKSILAKIKPGTFICYSVCSWTRAETFGMDDFIREQGCEPVTVSFDAWKTDRPNALIWYGGEPYGAGHFASFYRKK